MNNFFYSMLLATLLQCLWLSETHAATLKVEQGTLYGTREHGVDAFLGVPYAEPPVGENRWKMPRRAHHWAGTRLATHFAASCQQDLSDGFGPYTAEYLVSGKISEDCLYLNVWKPSASKVTERLPIMVWIHGGGYVSGSGSVPVYDGTAIASQGVVFVNFNYRLGVFGFLAHPELTLEGTGSGNYGLADIIAALQWVRDNAENLGGDRNQITIAGQSAGSMAVHDLIQSPAAKGLFARAISESGPGMGRPPVTLDQAEKTGEKLLRLANTTSISRLRALPVSEINRIVGQLKPEILAFAPVIDGKLLTGNPYASIPYQYSDTPILAGMNADESFVLPAQNADDFHKDIKNIFGNYAGEAQRLYAPNADSDIPSLSRTLRRDRGLASTLIWAEERRASSLHPMYLYLFSHVEPGTEAWGAFHTSEVPYALATLNRTSKRKFTEADHRVSQLASAYWINFVKTGNPNGKSLPHWAAFSNTEPELMQIDTSARMRKFLTPDATKLYRSYVAEGGQITLF